MHILCLRPSGLFAIMNLEKHKNNHARPGKNEIVNQKAFGAGFSNTASPKPSFLSGFNCVLASPTTSHTILFVSRYLFKSDFIFSTVIFFTIFSWGACPDNSGLVPINTKLNLPHQCFTQ